MTDTTHHQQFRTAAPNRQMRLCGARLEGRRQVMRQCVFPPQPNRCVANATRYLRWTTLEVLPPLETDRPYGS
jgi:hypothetical protein